MTTRCDLQALTDACIFTGEEWLWNKVLLIRDDRILDIVSPDSVPLQARKISLRGALLVPGLIDLQVNGGGNVLLNATPTTEGVHTIVAAHKRHGTARMLPTCITDKPTICQQALQAIREAAKQDPSILGVHFEGPFISRAGIHDPSLMRTCDEHDLDSLKPNPGETIILTLSPEKVTPEQIARLVANNVIVSLGHTDSTPEQIGAALSAGATGFTHLFNGMGGMEARNPGPSGTALDDRNSWCGLILDGLHVSPPLVRLALRAKPQGKVFIVSDAAPPAAAEHAKPYTMGGKLINVVQGRCIDDRDVLAGCANSLRENVIVGIRLVGIEPDEAFRMASAYPAAFIGRDKELGYLKPGYKADILALDESYNVRGLWIDGKPQAEAEMTTDY